jgi:hypothetical protein
MIQATDFDRKMLLLATQLAHDANLKILLLTVLESLLKYLCSQEGLDSEVEALTMVRYVAELNRSKRDINFAQLHHSFGNGAHQATCCRIVESWSTSDTCINISNRKNLVQTLVKHFQTGM